MVELLAYRPVHVNTPHGDSSHGVLFWTIAAVVVLFLLGVYVWGKVKANKRSRDEADALTARLSAGDSAERS